MTTANKITISRILMIPVFVLLAIYYGRSVLRGAPEEWLRISAIIVFVIAAASDGIDGYIARHYNQKSQLGVILDPIADKGLLLTAIITLTFSNWHYEFPLWFPVLIIARDVVVVCGAILLKYFYGDVEVRPSWPGKIATFLQMSAIGGAMLQLKTSWIWSGRPFLLLDLLVISAGLFTFISGVGYVRDGIRQLQAADDAKAA
jgi:cardiolipin synthase